MALGSLRVLCNYKSNANWQPAMATATDDWQRWHGARKELQKQTVYFVRIRWHKSEPNARHYAHTHRQREEEGERVREMTTCWPLDSLKSLSRFYFRFRLSSFFFCTFCTVQVFQSVVKSASIAVSVFISLSGRCRGSAEGST